MCCTTRTNQVHQPSRHQFLRGRLSRGSRSKGNVSSPFENDLDGTDWKTIIEADNSFRFPSLICRNQGATADIGMDGRVPGILRPVMKLSESGMHSYSRGASPSQPGRPGSCDRLGKDPSPRKSVESLCLLEEPGSSRMARREEDWGSELSTLELKPPTGFTDAHETSEAECDIDMKLKLHRKRTGFPSNSLSKSPKDFTITV